jgi:hypothetical protein
MSPHNWTRSGVRNPPHTHNWGVGSLYHNSVPYWGVPTMKRLKHYSEAELMHSNVYVQAAQALDATLQNYICRFLYLPPLPLTNGKPPDIWGRRPAKQRHVKKYENKYDKRQHHLESIGPKSPPYPKGWKPGQHTCSNCYDIKEKQKTMVFDWATKITHNATRYICPNCDVPDI